MSYLCNLKLVAFSRVQCLFLGEFLIISVEDDLRKKDLWFGTGKGGAYEKGRVSLAGKF